MDDYGLPAENKKYLWHPSEQDVYAPAIEHDGKHYLGTPEPISKGFKNPMALKTLHKLKALINYLIEAGKIDPDTRIVIEIARELNDTNKRKAIERWQREREKENDSYKKQIDEINKECNTEFDTNDKGLIDKIRLWNEQGKRCIYTGKTIGLCDILDGSKYDFEHTVPASMSFDNELKNLTISDKTYNQQLKGKRLPTECPNYEMEVSINGITYPAILNTMQAVFGQMTEVEGKRKIKGKEEVTVTRSFEKITNLEEQVEFWVYESKKAQTKERKDYCIQQRHLFKMNLEYWRYKLHTFITKEYKAGWRNSQLRDTQTITKYALPYLKTVFKKVEVQKGSITADFRKIYKIQHRTDKKERARHSHHAIDAAVLTLIPPAAVRDKILQYYNEAKDNNLNYHEKPRQWGNFNEYFIRSIDEDILINYQVQSRTLIPTYKVVRKRGKVQYKIDKSGNKILLISKGDSIRGQLHKESFFGAIVHKGELNLVERYPVSAFTSINDCRHIVDDAVRNIVQAELEKRMTGGVSFDKAKIDPIPFPNGKAVIKKVRCKVAAGRGYLTPEKALEVRKHDFKSKHSYKQHVYAQNEENTFCLYYESETERAFRIVGLYELATLRINKEAELYSDKYYNNIEAGRGKNKKLLSLTNILKVGTRVIFYKENMEELKYLDQKSLLMRVFRIYKFNEPAPSTVYVYFHNHIEARKNDDLGNGEKELALHTYQSRLFLGASKFTAAIEGKHFEIKVDGSINWLF